MRFILEKLWNSCPCTIKYKITRLDFMNSLDDSFRGTYLFSINFCDNTSFRVYIISHWTSRVSKTIKCNLLVVFELINKFGKCIRFLFLLDYSNSKKSTKCFDLSFLGFFNQGGIFVLERPICQFILNLSYSKRR